MKINSRYSAALETLMWGVLLKLTQVTCLGKCSTYLDFMVEVVRATKDVRCDKYSSGTRELRTINVYIDVILKHIIAILIL